MPDEQKGRFGPALGVSDEGGFRFSGTIRCFIKRPVDVDRIMTRLSMLAALLLAVGLAGQASASAWADSKPQNPAAAKPRITEAQARSIAFRHGLVHIEEIALADWRWEIAGRAQGGVEVTLDLNAYDGSVVGGAAAP
jgi:hypothetical protein